MFGGRVERGADEFAGALLVDGREGLEHDLIRRGRLPRTSVSLRTEARHAPRFPPLPRSGPSELRAPVTRGQVLSSSIPRWHLAIPLGD